MATEKLVDAIVRGPLPHFGKDGVLYMPGQVVTDVPASEVSDDPIEFDAEYEAANGDLRTRKLTKTAPFRPIDKKEATIAEHVDTATVATGQPDRINVTDFLKQSDDAVVAAIASGSVDDHLGVIEQGIVTGRKQRDAVKSAIAARIAGITRP